jgi:hypothetical protein
MDGTMARKRHKPEEIAYSDDAARVFQPFSAHRSNLMPPTIPI